MTSHPHFRLTDTVEVRGQGLHSGQTNEVVIEPVEPGCGLILNGTPVRPSRIISTRFATTVETDTGPVSTTEHLFAALAGAGLWDVSVTVRGSEIPILDGSSAAWYQAVTEKRAPCASLRHVLTMTSAIRVQDGESWICAEPDSAFCMSVTTEYPGIDSRTVVAGLESFQQLMAARTYGFKGHHQSLLRMGLAQAASFDNTLVLDESSRPLNPSSMCWLDEIPAHKWLDLLGDLAHLGYPLNGRITAHRPGHSLNRRLTMALAQMVET